MNAHNTEGAVRTMDKILEVCLEIGHDSRDFRRTAGLVIAGIGVGCIAVGAALVISAYMPVPA